MDWSKFFSMGGYAFYVWGSYLIAFGAIAGELIFLMRRKKNLVKQSSAPTVSWEVSTNENTP